MWPSGFRLSIDQFHSDSSYSPPLFQEGTIGGGERHVGKSPNPTNSHYGSNLMSKCTFIIDVSVLISPVQFKVWWKPFLKVHNSLKFTFKASSVTRPNIEDS